MTKYRLNYQYMSANNVGRPLDIGHVSFYVLKIFKHIKMQKKTTSVFFQISKSLT